MAQIRGMMASTLDGYAADSVGGVGFLDPFHDVDWGWNGFIAEIGTVVMGRKTYDHIWHLAPEWPYPGIAGIVLGHPAPPLRGPVTPCTDLAGLIPQLQAAERDVWVVGGPALQQEFITLGALDRLQLCILPVLLGNGIRTFPESPEPLRQPVLHGVTQLPKGMLLADYRFGDAGLGGRDR